MKTQARIFGNLFTEYFDRVEMIDDDGAVDES